MRAFVGVLALGILAACSEPQAPAELKQELRLEAVSALVQSVPVTGSVAARPRVRVVGVDGLPRGGVQVQFLRALGRPVLEGALATTNVMGEAVLIGWQVGTRAGPQEVRAVLSRNTSDTWVDFRVDVQPGPVTRTGLSADSVRIGVGESSAQLRLAQHDAYGNVVSVLTCATLTSEDPSIAEVLQDGSVRGVATGRVTIVVDSGSFRRAALVIVGDPAVGAVTALASTSDPVRAVATSPTGLTFAAPFAPGPSQFYRVEPGARLPTSTVLATPRVSDAAFHPDGSRVLFIGIGEQYVLVVDATTGTVTQELALAATAYRVAMSADGTFAVVTSDTRVWRIEMDDYAITEFALPSMLGPVNGVAIHPDDGRIFVSSMSGFLAVLDPDTGAHLQYQGGFGQLQGLAIDAVGNRLFVAREHAGVRVLDAETLAHISDSNPLADAYDLRWDPVREELWVTLGLGNAVLRYSSSALVPLERYRVIESRRLGIHPNGDVVVGGGHGLYLIER